MALYSSNQIRINHNSLVFPTVSELQFQSGVPEPSTKEETMDYRVYVVAAVNLTNGNTTMVAVTADSGEDARLAAAFQMGMSLTMIRKEYEMVVVAVSAPLKKYDPDGEEKQD